MTLKKQKEKDRRRARKLAEEAWQANTDGNLDLAVKLIRRAAETQPDNPVLWNDQGILLGALGKIEEAAKSFRSALRLAPTYAEAFANLAALRARQGIYWEAVALQEQALKHAAGAAGYAERLETYRALAADAKQLPAAPRPPAETAPPAPETAPKNPLGQGWLDRLAARDWDEIGKRLTREGCALLPGLLDGETCVSLAGLFDDDARFAKTVVMDRPDFGLGSYRYFKAPLPPAVDGLRRAVYPFAARIANGWRRLLGEPDDFPETWEQFREVCRAVGQTTPTPILLKYGPGGFNALHRDLRGQVFFPVQMAVVLNPRADPSHPSSGGFEGGDFLFCDVPEGEKSKRRTLPAGLGDGVLFCTRDRLEKVGGAYGLQPVKHGVSPITAGTRFVLGVPFHEYR